MFGIKFIFSISIFFLFKNTLILSEEIGGKEKFQCYVCDATNSNCTQNVKNGVELQDCSEDDKECFTKLDENGRNIRGCLKTGTPCKGNCDTCKDSGCNDKKYPKDRRECYICNGLDCTSPGEDKILTCIENIAEEKCYTYFDSIDTIRGCSKQKNESCVKYPEYCQECDSDNCNKMKTDALKCFKCDNEKDCKRPDPVPSEKCETNIKEEEECTVDKENDMNLCFTERRGNNTVARGCAKNKIKNKEKTEGITYCRGGNCNKICVEDIECPICQEKDDPTCAKNTISNSWYKNKCDSYTTVCHTCLNSDDLAFRGCGKPSDNLNCNFCYTSNCTAPVPTIERSCYKCDKNDTKCSHLQSEISQTETCTEGIMKCITKLDGDNYIERRCAQPDEKCPDNSDDKCKICDKNNCNIDVIPAKRLHCYQCDSTKSEECKDPTIKDATLEAYPCQIYKENDNCYTTNDTNIMIRGCSSDPDTNRKKCEENPKFCIHCDSDKCNNLPFMRTKLSCIQCEHNTTECALGHNANTAKNCQPSEFWKNETCFTYVESITNVTRGCTEDDINKNFNCTDNDKCKKCNTDGCNNENYFLQTCYKCRSDEIAECSYSKLKKIKPSKCRNSIADPKNKGCFIEKYYNGVIFRGCLVDLDQATQIKCIDNTYKDCTYCEGVDCNDGKVPGGNALVHSVSFTILFTSFVFYLIV